MSIALIGEGASYEFRWRAWALLRDVVVAHVDEATLPAFTSLGDAMVKSTIAVDAAALAGELDRIRPVLATLSTGDLVLGPRTSAMLHGAKPLARRPLSPVEAERIRPFGGAENLADYFATMLDSMARVCSRPRSDGTIEAIDG